MVIITGCRQKGAEAERNVTTMIHLDPTSRIPIYQQIKEQIIELIVMGVFPPESRLPSVRALATETGLNPNTVQKAYQELENEGVIYTVGGKGCFVGSRENAAEAKREQAEGELREALRRVRLAGIDRCAAKTLLEQCYGGEKAC